MGPVVTGLISRLASILLDVLQFVALWLPVSRKERMNKTSSIPIARVTMPRDLRIIGVNERGLSPVASVRTENNLEETKNHNQNH